MEFQEFCKQRDRMCRCYKYCRGCPYITPQGGTICTKWIANHPVEAEEILKTWLKDHPIKTRKTEFMKMFPNCPLDGSGYPDLKCLDDEVFPCDWDTEIKEEN